MFVKFILFLKKNVLKYIYLRAIFSCLGSFSPWRNIKEYFSSEISKRKMYDFV